MSEDPSEDDKVPEGEGADDPMRALLKRSM